MRKVLFISHDASRSGAPLSLLALLKIIKLNCIEIDSHLLLLSGGVLYDEFEQYATIVHIHKRKNLLLKIKKLLLGIPYKDNYEPFKAQSYNCIFANSVASLPKATIIKHELGCSLLLYVHEVSLIMEKLGVLKSNLQNCDIIIAASEMAQKNLIDNYQIRENLITVIHPPLFHTFYTAGKQLRQNDCQVITIGLSGTGCWGKGIDLLPFVINEVVTSYPESNYQFMWVGHLTDETIINLNYDLERLSIKNRLTIVGEVESPLQYYSQFDILLMLSREESFSLACVECIELGIPIVCMQDTLGIASILGSESLLSVPYLDIKGIANAINQIATNKAIGNKLANNAKQQLSSHYSPERSISSLLALLS